MLPNVNTSSGVPIYLQLVEQFRRAIASGVLREGDTLPSLRQLAKELRINPLTIKKAYGDLEAGGLVTTQHGRGTYVAGQATLLSRSERRKLLTQHVEKLIIEARHLGLSPDETRQLVEKHIQSWQQESDHG